MQLTVLQTVLLLVLVVLNFDYCLSEAHCWKRKYNVNYFGRAFNATIRCNQLYQWTVSEYCCYDRYDQLDNHPFCCYSETYKLLIAVGIICVMVLSAALFVFVCWLYNLPYYLLKILTCGKFNLNDYMKKTKMTGPYVDPSFYAGEPFWTSEGSEYSHYPLRPMPPRIFYPVPAKVDFRRWSNQRHMGNTQTPLFILASKNFTRNPYSARPNDRGSASSSISGPSGVEGVNSSRRSSTSSYIYDSNGHRNIPPSFGFKVHLDEVDAASELLEALRSLDEKGDKSFIIPKVKEETQKELDMDLENELIDNEMREHMRRKETEKEYAEIPRAETSSLPLVPVHSNVLDVSKLSTLQCQRTGSGTSFKRFVMRGGSVDSTNSCSSAFPLESISEEYHSHNRQQLKNTLSSSAYVDESGSSTSNNLPGYIPEETELDISSQARKSISTA